MLADPKGRHRMNDSHRHQLWLILLALLALVIVELATR